MNTIKIFQCEDSIDGIFTAVYQAWSSGYGHDNVKIEVCEKTVIRTWSYFPSIFMSKQIWKRR